MKHETDKEWIARGGHLGANMDALDVSPRSVYDWNVNNRPASPEQAFWSHMIIELVKDAIGINPGVKNEICSRCHADMDCGCYQVFVLPSGQDYIRKTKKGKCPKAYKDHTVQACAIYFINNDPMCEEYCTMLGITVSYLRQYIKKGVFNGSDFTKQRSGITPKIATKALYSSGRAGKARGAARPSEMGG